ncbi:asparaginase [Streptomyces sp. NPDC008313]|uniref:asparaginase n=1 Tax=Streptomyces sp. NPDC008313 TaxID=3364826 RepID=UPI0036F0D28A
MTFSPNSPLAGRTVAVFSLGGTIAMTTDPVTGGVVPALSAKDLLTAVPALRETGVVVRVQDFRQLPGASLRIEDIVDLASAIGAELDAGADGAVVTQGTDTIEETAFLLHLLHDRPEPVVVTGAMRNPTLPGADGPANLHAAVLVAADQATRELGCVVVLNDEIHSAVQVRKSHTTSTGAFTSPGAGPVGRVHEGRPTMVCRPLLPSLPRLARSSAGTAQVGLYTVTLGDDGTHLESFAGGYDGLVVAAFGVGHVPRSMVGTLERLAAGMPVVLCSRVGDGPVLKETYGFPGSEKDLRTRGLIGAGSLSPYKARLLLIHLLTGFGPSGSTDIRAAFAELETPS